MTRVQSPPAATRRVDGSMSLLVDMMTNTLDESYAEAAQRRAGAAARGPGQGASRLPDRASLRRRGTATVLLLALGLVTGTAAAQVRKRQAAGVGVRRQLIADVHRRTAESETLATQAGRLRREVATLQDGQLRSSDAGAALARRLAELQLAVGVDAVTGPGLVVRLDDAPRGSSSGTDRGGQLAPGRVQDRDLQDAVNGLWSAGAEAVAINGLRLSALTAIRSAGEAILVDYRPVSPPYAVSAIGAPDALAAGFADSAAGRRLATYATLYGLRLDVRQSSKETLPGAGTPTLRLAHPTQAGS